MAPLSSNVTCLISHVAMDTGIIAIFRDHFNLPIQACTAASLILVTGVESMADKS